MKNKFLSIITLLVSTSLMMACNTGKQIPVPAPSSNPSSSDSGENYEDEGPNGSVITGDDAASSDNLIYNEEYYTFGYDYTPMRHENFILFTKEYLIEWTSYDAWALEYKKSGNSISFGTNKLAYTSECAYEKKEEIITELINKADENKNRSFEANYLYYAHEKGRLDCFDRFGNVWVRMTASYAEKLGYTFKEL